MTKRKRSKTTPEQFFRATLTDADAAELLLLDFTEEERLDVLTSLLFHTVRAYFDGKPPGWWRRRMALWRFYDHFGPQYRDEIAMFVDAPFNPTRVRDVTPGPHVHQIIMRMCALIVQWLRWSEEDIEVHIAETVRTSSYFEANAPEWHLRDPRPGPRILIPVDLVCGNG